MYGIDTTHHITLTAEPGGRCDEILTYFHVTIGNITNVRRVQNMQYVIRIIAPLLTVQSHFLLIFDVISRELLGRISQSGLSLVLARIKFILWRGLAPLPG
jgi:hypothetical protein